MTNQDTLREIQRGYRLEKPHYPGSDATNDQLKGVYGVLLSPLTPKILVWL